MNDQNIFTILVLTAVVMVSIGYVYIVVKYHLRIRASVTAFGVRIACALQRSRTDSDVASNS